MSEKKIKPEETLCPFLVAATIMVVGINPDRKEVILQVKDGEIMAGACLGRRCQLYSPHMPGCGLRNR